MVRLVGLCCCPPWPSTLRGRASSVPSRTIVSGARIRLMDVRSSLLTFAPSIPTRPGPAARMPGLATGRPSFLSWDCPKIAPPSSCSPGSPLPEAACRLPGGQLPSGWECHFPSTFRPRGPAPPRRFPPPCRDPRLAADFRPWGSPRFRPLAALDQPSRADRSRAPALSRGAFLPSEAFPPNTAADARACARAVRGRSSPPASSPIPVFTDLLALSPLPPTRLREVAFSSSTRRPDLRAFLRARVRCRPRRCQRGLPGAPLGLDDISWSRFREELRPGCHQVRQRPFE